MAKRTASLGPYNPQRARLRWTAVLMGHSTSEKNIRRNSVPANEAELSCFVFTPESAAICLDCERQPIYHFLDRCVPIVSTQPVCGNHTEKYWCLSDGRVAIGATTTFSLTWAGTHPGMPCVSAGSNDADCRHGAFFRRS